MATWYKSSHSKPPYRTLLSRPRTLLLARLFIKPRRTAKFCAGAEQSERTFLDALSLLSTGTTAYMPAISAGEQVQRPTVVLGQPWQICCRSGSTLTLPTPGNAKAPCRMAMLESRKSELHAGVMLLHLKTTATRNSMASLTTGP